MTNEIIPAIVIVLLLIERFTENRSHRGELKRLLDQSASEREVMTRAIIAKDAQDYAASKAIEKEDEKEKLPPEFKELDPNDEETFDEGIQNLIDTPRIKV